MATPGDPNAGIMHNFEVIQGAGAEHAVPAPPRAMRGMYGCIIAVVVLIVLAVLRREQATAPDAVTGPSPSPSLTQTGDGMQHGADHDGGLNEKPVTTDQNGQDQPPKGGELFSMVIRADDKFFNSNEANGIPAALSTSSGGGLGWFKIRKIEEQPVRVNGFPPPPPLPAAAAAVLLAGGTDQEGNNKVLRGTEDHAEHQVQISFTDTEGNKVRAALLNKKGVLRGRNGGKPTPTSWEFIADKTLEDMPVAMVIALGPTEVLRNGPA